MDAGGLYKLGTMTNSEQNVIFVYIYLDGGLRVGWFCTSTKTAHSYVIQSDTPLSIQIHLNNNRFWHGKSTVYNLKGIQIHGKGHTQ